MGVPLIQQYRVGRYILGQKLKGNTRYPLVLMLEPCFAATWPVPAAARSTTPKKSSTSV